MCNLSMGILERGIERGIERGTENTKIESLKKLIKNLHITFEEAANILEIPAEDRKNLADKV